MPGYQVHLQNGGEVPHRLQCSHCQLVLKDPVQTTQRLLFCRECFEETNRQSLELDPNNEVIAVKEEIDKLLVMCPHNGCQWGGEFKDLFEHSAACDHVNRAASPPFGVQPESDISSSTGQSQSDEYLQQHSGSSEEVFSIHRGNQDLHYSPMDMTSQLNAISDQLKSVVRQVEEIIQDKNIQQVTVVELQSAVRRLQYDMRALRIDIAAGFTNCKLTWPIPQLSQKYCGKELLIFSPPFYTEADGYKMCLCVYLDGNGAGHKTHISIFFVIMRGEYDSLLEWPFNYKVSITIVNQYNQADSITHSFQSTNTVHFQRPITSMNTGTGFPKFTSLSVLRDPKYVKDDTMFIKAKVETFALV